jgi:hypothetical protein
MHVWRHFAVFGMEQVMELLKFDDKARVFTLALEQREFLDIYCVMAGVLATYKDQDPLIIGVERDRLDEVSDALTRILKHVNAVYGKPQ